MSPRHEVIAARGEPTGALSPLAAELAALLTTVNTAVARGARDLRVHPDCPALGHLWQDRRGEEIISNVRQAARPLRRLRLRLVPRRFNQVANALARDAVRRAQSQTDHVPHSAQNHSTAGNDRS